MRAWGGRRQLAFSAVVCAWVPGGLLLLLLALTVRADERRAQGRVREALDRAAAIATGEPLSLGDRWGDGRSGDAEGERSGGKGGEPDWKLYLTPVKAAKVAVAVESSEKTDATSVADSNRSSRKVDIVETSPASKNLLFIE